MLELAGGQGAFNLVRGRAKLEMVGLAVLPPIRRCLSEFPLAGGEQAKPGGSDRGVMGNESN